MKCAPRTAGEMELADGFHVTLGTFGEPEDATLDRHAEQLFRS